ncbi:MAG TPA: hypothetical protein PLX89_07010 [Verrucomicrobiota bacterium]|nr:hypothetical protein [Verrucomicrobiales bacterium]HRI12740.1 hypothetical protein [Verrucomicrobiota bacterium]
MKLIHLRFTSGGLLLLASAVHGAPFLYAPGDFILAFRQTGNAQDLVVNAGSVTNFTDLPLDATVPITNLSDTQLRSVFPSLNAIYWSVAAANRPPLVEAFPIQSLWVTAPRLDPELPSVPWLRKGQFVQGNAGSQIDGLGAAAAGYSSRTPAGPDNTATGVAIPVSNEASFTSFIGSAGDFQGSFQGNVENLTPDDFEDTPGAVSRSDFFELPPGTTAAGTLNAPGRHLGYFELKSDGTLVFSNKASAVPTPQITGIQRDGDQTIVSFTTVVGPTYQLRATDQAGFTAPSSSWPIVGSLEGTGGPASLSDTSADPTQFYVVDVVP